MKDLKKHFEEGITYETYLEGIISDIKEQKELFEYSELNLKRMERVQKKFVLNDSQKEELNALNKNFQVIIISEGWCGDASQTLPVFKHIFEFAEIPFRIVLRDQNLELIEEYLTNGAIAIPIVVAFDEEGKELFHWGPRPQLGKDLLKQHKDNPEEFPKEEFYKKLQMFYNKDKGKSTYSEILNLMKNG